MEQKEFITLEEINTLLRETNFGSRFSILTSDLLPPSDDFKITLFLDSKIFHTIIAPSFLFANLYSAATTNNPFIMESFFMDLFFMFTYENGMVEIDGKDTEFYGTFVKTITHLYNMFYPDKRFKNVDLAYYITKILTVCGDIINSIENDNDLDEFIDILNYPFTKFSINGEYCFSNTVN